MSFNDKHGSQWLIHEIGLQMVAGRLLEDIDVDGICSYIY
jgi:uncharacterized membrane protein YecN with MAPEG domain